MPKPSPAGTTPGAPAPARTPPKGIDVALAVASRGPAQAPTLTPLQTPAATAVKTPLTPALPSPLPSSLPSPLPPAPRASAAFLTPRVVDQRAFEDFAGQLRQLAADADARAAHLAEVTARAERTMQAASDSARQHRAAVEVLGKLLHALNARAGEVSELVARCDRALESAARAERALESAAERVAGRFEARFAAGLEEIARGPAASQVASLIDDAERVKDELNLTSRRMGEERVKAADAGKDFAAALDRSRAEASDLVARAERAGASLASQLRAADDVGTRAFQRIQEAADAAAPLESLLGSCARADTSLKSGVREADRVREASADIAKQLSALLHKADASREELRSWAALLSAGGTGAGSGGAVGGAVGGTVAGVNGAGPARLPEPLERIVREFRTSLAQDLSKMAGAMSLIARRAETSVRAAQDGPEIIIRAGSAASVATD